MRILSTTGILLIAFTGFATSQAQSTKPQLVTVDVVSSPEGAMVTLYDVHERDYQRSCVTPCKLEVDASRYLGIYGQKDGYISRDIKHPTLPGLGTVKNFAIHLYTPEEEKTKEGRREENLRKKAEHEAWVENMYSNPGLLAPVPNCEGISERNISVRATNRFRAKSSVRLTGEHTCTIRFNISIDGVPGDVEALDCTHPAWEAQSVKTVIGSRYKPRIIGGETLPYCGIEQKFSFRIHKPNSTRTRRPTTVRTID